MDIQRGLSLAFYILLVLLVNYVGAFLIIGVGLSSFPTDSKIALYFNTGSVLLLIFSFLSAVTTFLSFIFRYELNYRGNALWKIAISQMIFLILMAFLLFTVL